MCGRLVPQRIVFARCKARNDFICVDMQNPGYSELYNNKNLQRVKAEALEERPLNDRGRFRGRDSSD